MALDIQAIRRQFTVTEVTFDLPCTDRRRPLTYLDHAASTHPPREVLDRYRDFIEHSYANIHRGLHSLSRISTDLFEHVSSIIADFIGADLERNCVIYTQNTTEALDLAAHVMAPCPGAVLTTELEHHSNELPHRRRGEVRHVGLRADGTLDMDHLAELLGAHRIKLVAVTAGSNVTGVMPDIHRIAGLAHAYGARILVDAAQVLAHHEIDVRPDQDPQHIDFLAAAGHKAYAPFGAAFLFGPRDVLDAAEPYRPGGGTIHYVTVDNVHWRPSPDRHQGGTPNVPGVIALACALQFLDRVGMADIREHERALLRYCLDRLQALDGIEIYGPADTEHRLGVVSFNIDGIHHAMVSAILNNEAAIATRNGCFCAHAYLHRLLRIPDPDDVARRLLAGEDIEMPGAVRASFGIFNTEEEIDLLTETLIKVRDRDWVGDYRVDQLDVCGPLLHAFSLEPGVATRPARQPA